MIRRFLCVFAFVLLRSKEINDAVWEFFKKNPLPAEPKYTVYKDPD
jgi:hypothetical protein